MMRAVTFESNDKPLCLRELPRPEPGPGQLLLKVKACGICGSDLHAYQTAMSAPGTVFGHEFAGEVAAIGEGVEGDWQIGDRVIAVGALFCGECSACRDGHVEQCPNIELVGFTRNGAYADYVVTQAAGTVRLPDAVSFRQGALVEPLAVGLRAAARLGDVQGRDVAVIGAGNIGLTSALSAKALGAGRVVVFARYPHQADMALRLGMDAARLDPPAEDEAYPCVIDSVATKETLDMSMALVDLFGTIVFAGAVTEPAELRLDPLMAKEARLTAEE